MIEIATGSLLLKNLFGEWVALAMTVFRFFWIDSERNLPDIRQANLQPAEDFRQQGFLRVQPVFRLLEDN